MSATTELHFGPYVLHGREGPLLHEGEEIKLQPRALALLWTLASQPGEVISKTVLLDAIWPRQSVGEDVLAFQVKALRRALQDDPKNPRYILTAHRVGLRFGQPVSRGGSRPAAPQGPLLVGRAAELAALEAAWQSALAGQRQLLFITGDAGMGKSALLTAFQREHARHSPQALWARGHCLEYAAASEPYLPVLEALGHLLRKAADDKPIELMRRVAPSWLLQLPDLLSDSEQETLKRQTSGVPKERMLRELAEALEQLSQPSGLLLLIEDLHWSDAATIDLIAHLAQRTAQPDGARLMLLVSLRPVDAIVSAHPARRLQLALKSRTQAREIALPSLTPEAVRDYLSTRLDLGQLPPDLPQRVFGHCDGQPLFMVQIADYLERHPEAAQHTDSGLQGLIPDALRDLIHLQLSTLPAAAQQVLEAASVVGSEFSAAAVAAATNLPLEEVEPQLEALADPPRFIESIGLMVWPDGTSTGHYRFRHALYQQVLRRKLLDTRRTRMHLRIAEAAEAAWGKRIGEIVGELALHFEQGGHRTRALFYRLLTARRALERVAFDETQQQVALGQQLLDAVPEGPARDQAELALSVMAAHSLQNQHGYTCTEADALFGRITLLVERCTDAHSLQMALYCLWLRRHFQCRLDEALEYARRLPPLGERVGNPAIIASGHAFTAISLHMQGRFTEAQRHITQAQQLLAALPPQQFGIVLDLRTSALNSSAILQWMLGASDEALATARQARALAESSGNPYSLCLGRASTLNSILVYRRDWAEVLVESADCLKVSTHYNHRDGIYWSQRQYALALAWTGQPEQGLPLLWKTLDTLRAQGSLLGLPMDYTLGAECCIRLGDYPRARWALDAAWEIIRTRQTVAFESETRRMEGELLLAQAPTADLDSLAEGHLRQALQLATQRQAPWLQLRAAVSLARLWQRQGRRSEGRELLQTHLAALSEGHQTSDWQNASALLNELL